MSVCRSCGQPIPSKKVRPHRISDSEILNALKTHPAQHGMMIYAAGTHSGGADYSSWHLTYGALSGALIEQGQVDRLVKRGLLVPYVDGSDAAYVTPEERQRLDAKQGSKRP